ncbi:hypothetical protein B9N56_09215 [Finegoldia magna]|uniref:Uncharacterized protein n=1 Tax=Finegoldia magna TaxID=1260 RepID=A0A233W4J5_FINMA|nr:hypothetical protein [Finegoldia magna]OXZ36597.1 hypothetical protein B9N56_09215 [Finegoldia magna]OXZ39576.1 hypothetical protein B9N58_08700 [Finegoldia magna]
MADCIWQIASNLATAQAMQELILPESEADARSLEFFLAMLMQSKKKGAFAPCKDKVFFSNIFSQNLRNTPAIAGKIHSF